MEHEFTPIIRGILRDHFGAVAEEIFEKAISYDT